MPLNLYRRHHRTAGKCTGGYPVNLRNYESDELRRGWKKCHCPIYAVGTLNGEFRRRNTKRTDWEEAKVVAFQWESAARWGDEESPVQLIPEIPETIVQPTTIEGAIRLFLSDHAGRLAVNTRRKYEIICRKLAAFSSARGHIFLEQWTPSDVREFRQSWRVNPLTTSKNLSLVKAFFEFALVNEWIEKNPARLVKDPRMRAGDGPRAAERLPFTDAEIRRMFEACANEYGKRAIKWSKERHDQLAAPGLIANYRYKWSGQDLADFIAVSVYTGLRISDVCAFHIDRVQASGECHIRTTKNGRKVYTWIPDWLQQRIRARAAEHGPLIFGSHTTIDTNSITELWRRRLKNLWRLCEPWEANPTPHRFRHTFARILLQRPNVTVRDVAELLGDTEDVVRRHYAAWVTERQERLTKILQDAFDEKPRPI